jgi:hypothetical protein
MYIKIEMRVLKYMVKEKYREKGDRKKKRKWK